MNISRIKNNLIGLGFGGSVLLEKAFYRPFIHEHNFFDMHIADSYPNFAAVIGLSYIATGLLNLKNKSEYTFIASSNTAGILLYEFNQINSNDRTFDVNDIAATVLGGIATYCLLRLTNKTK